MRYDILEKYPHQVSGGQRQRIAILMALLKSSKILIVDEFFVSIDIINQLVVIDIFYKVKERTEN